MLKNDKIHLLHQMLVRCSNNMYIKNIRYVPGYVSDMLYLTGKLLLFSFDWFPLVRSSKWVNMFKRFDNLSLDDCLNAAWAYDHKTTAITTELPQFSYQVSNKDILNQGSGNYGSLDDCIWLTDESLIKKNKIMLKS